MPLRLGFQALGEFPLRRAGSPLGADGLGGATADGRDEGHFVALVQHEVGPDVGLIDGDQAAGGRQGGHPGGELGLEVADAGAFDDLGLETVGAGRLAIAGEQPHRDGNLLGYPFGHKLECKYFAPGGVLHSVLHLAPPESAPTERFDEVFGRLYPEVFGLTYRVLGERMATEDVLQESFLKLARDKRLQSRPDGEVAAWLRRVALNLAFNRVRSERRDRARLERLAREEGDGSGEQSVLRQEEQAEVRRALASLPERQRACLLLRHSGYAYAEIAETLGVALGSVGVLLARAEAAFRLTYRRQTP